MKNVVVGMIFFGGLALLLYFTAVADREILSRIFGGEPPPEDIITVRFADAGQMTEGTQVRASGMKVGTVKDLAYEAKSGKVEVQIQLDETLVLYPDHEFVVKPESALGGRYVDVNIGDTKLTPLPDRPRPEQINEGRVQADALDELSSMLSENRPDIRKSIENIRKVTSGLADGEGTVGKILRDEEMYDELMAAVRELKEAIETARTGQGTIAKLLNDPKAYDELVAAIERIQEASDSIASVAAKVDRGEGTIGKLINDPVVADDIARLVKNAADAVEKVNKGEGPLAVLVNDVETGKNLKRTIANVAQVSDQIASGQGTLGKFLNDSRLYDDLLATVANFKEMSGDLNAGKGTIGRLIKDETIYFELRKAIRSITSSVEDAREQAPVSLFTSILFSAF